MGTGLSQKDLNILIEGLKGSLLAGQKLKVYVFGSRARGDYKKYSDIDLLVEAEPLMNSRQRRLVIDFYEDSDLPIKVDLVLKEDLVDSFRPSVESDKKLIFELEADGDKSKLS